MTAHYDKNNFFVTSFTQTPMKIFISSLKNSYDFLIVYTKCYFSNTFSHLSTHHPIFITAKTPFHHCTFLFITAHFVHHCTFCASLHVKTCPVSI